MSAPAHTPAQAPERRPLLATATALQRDYPIVQVVAIVAIFLFGAATLDNFTAAFSIKAMLVLASLLGISALGQTLCVLIGGLDVSIAGWILVGATVTVELLGGTGDRWEVWQVFLFLGLGSFLVGALTGWICHRFMVPALVMTLAVGAMVTGGVLAWKRGFVTGVPPEWLSNVSSPAGDMFGVGIPPVIVIWIVLAVAAYIVLRRTIPGAWVYATGNNPRAARLALVPTSWVWAGVYGLSALSATTAGVLLAGFAAGGEATIGEPYLWNGVTAVIVGGTAFGARGDYFRTVLGTLLLIVLAQVMVGHGAVYADQTILYGILILVVVAIYGRDRRLGDQV